MEDYRNIKQDGQTQMGKFEVHMRAVLVIADDSTMVQFTLAGLLSPRLTLHIEPDIKLQQVTTSRWGAIMPPLLPAPPTYHHNILNHARTSTY